MFGLLAGSFLGNLSIPLALAIGDLNYFEARRNRESALFRVVLSLILLVALIVLWWLLI